MAPSVAVVGLGRVGLPLALAFADRGLDVIGVERERTIIESVTAGRMPFREPGADELLQRVLASGRLELTAEASDAARADHIVLTLGTPAYENVEIDVSQIRDVVDDLLPVLREGHSIVLRSTVAPGTTEWVAGYIEQRRGLRTGETLFVSHVPERIAANRFLEEIPTLPCIVGGVDPESGARAAELFEAFGTEIVQTTPAQAELAKIWTNILRYAQFALPNLLMMECEQYGANVFDVIDLINHDYPRGGIAAPGLTAGACLRKDFAFSEERSSAPGMLLAVSRVHETVPLFLVKGLKARLGGAARPQDGGAGAHLQARLRRPARLALLQAGAAAGARAGPRRPPRPARRGGLGVARVGARRRRGGGHRHQPLRLRGSGRPAARGHAGGGPVERDRHSGVFAHVAHQPGSSEQGTGHRRRRHDRRGGGTPAGRRSGLGGARVRPARGAGLDAPGLRGPHRRPAPGRRGGRAAAATAPTSSTSPRSSAASPTSTSFPTRCWR